MTMPKQSEIEVPLLEVLNSLGGSAKPKDIYPLVTRKFPDLTQEDLNETMFSGGNKWTNRIQWVRQKLIDVGELSNIERGEWTITEKGKQRLKGAPQNAVHISNIGSQVSMIEIYDNYEEDFKSQLLDRLHEMAPRQFEIFAKKLLQVYGFVNVEVTKVGPDGGIDGFGMLKVGLASMNVAFQCKRWKENVSSTEIDKFRGAIQGEYEQGLFFTTSTFTENATKKSIKRGSVPIILMDGISIVDIMIEKGLGVEKRPLYLYYERVQDFLDEE